MVPGEQFPIISDRQQLEQAGFSNDEVSHLLLLKARFHQGIHDWGDLEQKRLEFARWLYTHGYLKR
jgi:hypothetical protein